MCSSDLTKVNPVKLRALKTNISRPDYYSGAEFRYIGANNEKKKKKKRCACRSNPVTGPGGDAHHHTS